jgi:dipeptidyl aminopeptidase/acylaminoacyl peptidase
MAALVVALLMVALSNGPAAVSHGQANTSGLVIRSLDGKFVRQIPLTGQSNWVPMWSPDGKSLAFAVVENERRVLAVVAREGNTPRVFQEAVSATGQSFKWSPDSQSIGFLDPQRRRLQLLNVATGKVRMVAEDSTANVGSWIWRPDGRSIVAVKTNPGDVPGLRGLRRRVDEITLDGKQRTLLDTATLEGAPGVSFIDPDNIFVRYNASADRFSTNGGARKRLADLVGSVRPTTGAHATAPRSGMWAGLLNVKESGTGKIEFISSRTGERRLVDVPFRFPLPASPEWTPDGRELIVVGQSSGEEVLKLYRVPVDGGVPVLIGSIGENTDGWTNVSPDGKLVVYSVFHGN